MPTLKWITRFIVLMALPINLLLSQKSIDSKEVIWEQYFGWIGNDQLNDIIVNKYGQFVAVGHVSIESKSSDIMLRIFDKEKNPTLKNIGGIGKDEAQTVIESQTDGYIVGGVTDTPWSDAIGKEDGFILKIKEDRSLAWNMVIGTTNDDAVFKLLKFGQDYLAICSFDHKITFIVLDENGVKKRQIETEIKDDYVSSQYLSDGKLLIATTTGESHYSRSTLYFFNKELELNNSYKVKFRDLAQVKDFVQIEGDRNIYLVGNRYQKKTGSDIGVFAYDPMTQLTKEISTVSFPWDEFATSIAFANNQFIITGTTFSHIRNAKRSNGLMCKIDQGGAVKEVFHFGGSKDEKIIKSLIGPNGDLVIAGGYTKSGGEDGWVAIIDKIEKEIDPSIPYDLVLETIDKTLSPRKTSNYYPGESVQFNLAFDPILSSPDYVNILLKSSKECISEDKHLMIRLSETNTVEVPLQISPDCLPGVYPVEVSYNHEGDLRVLYTEYISVVEKPFYSVDASLDQIDFEQSDNTYNIVIKVFNQGNTSSTFKPLLFGPDFVSIESDNPIAIAHAVNDTAILNYKLKINNVSAAQKLDLRLSIINESENYSEVFPISVNTIDILDRVEEKRFKEFVIEQKTIALPALDLRSEPLQLEEEITIIQDLTWQHPYIDREGQSIDFLQSNLPLRLRISSNVDLEKSQVKILVNGKTPVEGIVYYRHNESFYFTDEVNNRKYYVYKNMINLVRGENQIAVLVENENGSSSRSSFYVYYEPPKSNLHIFSVGIDYSKSNYPLQYPTKDAEEIAESFMSQEKKMFDDVYKHVLNDYEATKAQNIVKFFLEKVNDAYVNGQIANEDMVLLYISGHGFIDPDDGSFRIAGSDFDERTIAFTSLDYEKDVLKHISKIPCKKLILFDACNSGAIINQTDEVGTKNIKLLSEISLSKALEKLSKAGENTFILSSSSASQKSYEDPKWENGAFTESILEAFSKKDGFSPADQNKDEVLYIKELYNYLRKRVPSLVKEVKNEEAIQVPYMNLENKEDLPIFYLGGL